MDNFKDFILKDKELDQLETELIMDVIERYEESQMERLEVDSIGITQDHAYMELVI